MSLAIGSVHYSNCGHQMGLSCRPHPFVGLWIHLLFRITSLICLCLLNLCLFSLLFSSFSLLHPPLFLFLSNKHGCLLHVSSKLACHLIYLFFYVIIYLSSICFPYINVIIALPLLCMISLNVPKHLGYR